MRPHRLQLLDVLENKHGGGPPVSAPQQQGSQQSPYQVNNMSLSSQDTGPPPQPPLQRQVAITGMPVSKPQMHGRQPSYSGTPQQNVLGLQLQSQQPVQHPSDPASTGSQSFHTPQNPPASTPKAPGSPQKAGPPVWSGPVQWTFVDPTHVSKRELAFYVDAIPIRANATVEL
jgi:hypothetical protein